MAKTSQSKETASVSETANPITDLSVRISELEAKVNNNENKANHANVMLRKLKGVLKKDFGIDLDALGLIAVLFAACATDTSAADLFKLKDSDASNRQVFVVSGTGTGAANVTVIGTVTASTITATGTITGQHTNYNAAASTVGLLTVQTTATINAETVANSTIGNATVQTNATIGGTLAVTGTTTLADTTISDVTPTFAATSLVFTASAVAGPTNEVVADGVGIRVKVNGTNLLIRATPN